MRNRNTYFVEHQIVPTRYTIERNKDVRGGYIAREITGSHVTWSVLCATKREAIEASAARQVTA